MIFVCSAVFLGYLLGFYGWPLPLSVPPSSRLSPSSSSDVCVVYAHCELLARCTLCVSTAPHSSTLLAVLQTSKYIELNRGDSWLLLGHMILKLNRKKKVFISQLDTYRFIAAILMRFKLSSFSLLKDCGSGSVTANTVWSRDSFRRLMYTSKIPGKYCCRFVNTPPPPFLLCVS